MEKICTTGQTKKLAQQLAKEIKPGHVLALYGSLGSGKTTFTRYLAEAIGFKSRVQSPTFVIARNYKISEGRINKINHVDLYRLKNLEEVEDIGIYDLFKDPNSITVIEWPELIENILPENSIRIYFEYADKDKRKIKLVKQHV